MADEPIIPEGSEDAPKLAPDTQADAGAEKVAPAEVAGPDDEGGEPGGADPQAVRARKEYRARKAAQEQLATERLEKARLEGELKALKEKPAEPKAPDKVYNLAELQAAVDGGQLTQAEMTAYLVKQEAKRIREESNREAQAQKPIELAKSEINEYFQFVPDLADKSSETFKKAAQEYAQLLERGLPDNKVTEALAVKIAVGSLDRLRKRQEVANNTRNGAQFHAETGAGGTQTPKAPDISKAPVYLVESWDRKGTTPDQRNIEFKYWQEKQTRRQGRAR